jgi:hypothetical protein
VVKQGCENAVLFEIRSCQSGEDVQVGLLGCNVVNMEADTNVSEKNITSIFRAEVYVSGKTCLLTSSHGVTMQKNNFDTH